MGAGYPGQKWKTIWGHDPTCCLVGEGAREVAAACFMLEPRGSYVLRFNAEDTRSNVPTTHSCTMRYTPSLFSPLMSPFCRHFAVGSVVVISRVPTSPATRCPTILCHYPPSNAFDHWCLCFIPLYRCILPSRAAFSKTGITSKKKKLMAKDIYARTVAR